ncbi:uncharacterized protein LOC141906294 [Tubulanus polymorphus]|uniref:uncharacterized protein LOC141906294 n=1 Tax=Tubulanus polymorphus TaxID=672921 RepID=UPI003DA2F920
MVAVRNLTREESCVQQYDEWSGRFYINVFVLPQIMLTGLVMNSLIIAIFTRLKSSHPSIHLLKCLAIADISLLLSHFLADTLRYLLFYVNYGDNVFIDPFHIYPKMYAYGARVLRFGFMYQRNWLTVLIQLERLLTVLFPLKASQWWTKKRMNRIITVATLLIFPSVIILIVNTALIATLCVKFRQRKKLGGTGSQQTLKGDSKATRMVISMSITFLLLEMPETFSKVRSYALPNAVIWEVAFDIAHISGDVDSCVNFILYCIVNKQFLHTLKKLV